MPKIRSVIRQPSSNGSLSKSPTQEPRSPAWDDDLGVLSVDGVPVYVLEKPAPNQRAILNAFQKASWPAFIANPIEPDSTTDEHARLRSAVYKLNRGMKGIELLRFRCNGKGTGVIWEWLPTKKKKNR